ncbi:head closure Hc1 [Arthrobacter phage Reedo]|uniref:Head-to-tail stopper n=1 Tax=Arthrobacter phage Reedo TaxID=2910755 RepID=A0AA49H0U6_9CAUD|nr:head closure Hc1 [Arthrobacter phage Reedo]UJQ86800.1 head-to-tail stopper [Arthrobacter phage Reedo]
MLLTAYRVAPTVYRLRAGTTVDSYGDPVESWTAPERTPLKGATIQNISIVEDDGVTRHVTRRRKTLYAPGAVDLRKDDRIESNGEVWRVDGDPVTRAGLASAVYTTAELERVSIG